MWGVIQSFLSNMMDSLLVIAEKSAGEEFQIAVWTILSQVSRGNDSAEILLGLWVMFSLVNGHTFLQFKTFVAKVTRDLPRDLYVVIFPLVEINQIFCEEAWNVGTFLTLVDQIFHAEKWSL